MKLLPLLAAAVLVAPATAQVVEIGSMTVPAGNVLPQDIGAGTGGTTFTEADFNAAATGGTIDLQIMDLVPSTAAPGIYSTNVTYPSAIAAINGYQLGLTSLSFPNFDAFNADITLGGLSTEIGFGVADWIGPVIIDFYDNGTLVANHTSSTYSTANPFIYQSSAAFDQLFVQASTTSGNWCFTEFFVEETGPAGPALAATGAPGGSMTFDFTGFQGGEQIAVVYGPAGTLSNNIPCGPVTIDLLPLNYPPISGLILLTADGAGAASLTQGVPGGASGLRVQGVGTGSCGVSNFVTL